MPTDVNTAVVVASINSREKMKINKLDRGLLQALASTRPVSRVLARIHKKSHKTYQDINTNPEREGNPIHCNSLYSDSHTIIERTTCTRIRTTLYTTKESRIIPKMTAPASRKNQRRIVPPIIANVIAERVTISMFSLRHVEGVKNKCRKSYH
jgi:hypothetical protein